MSAIWDFDPRNLPAPHLRAIGLVTASAAQTEHMVQLAIAGLLGIDMDCGAALTAHMTAPLRDSIARAVAEIRFDDIDHIDELNGLLDGVGTALARRHAVVHGSWCRNPANGDVFSFSQTARGTLESRLVPMPVDQIEREAALIYEAGIGLYAFMIRHDLVPPDPINFRDRAHKTPAARKKRRKALRKHSLHH